MEILNKGDKCLSNYTTTELLEHVIYDHSIEKVKMLLENGADVNIKEDEAWTHLMAAAKECEHDIIKLLIDFGADVNISHKGMRALNYARGNEHLRSSQVLQELEALTLPVSPDCFNNDETFAELCKFGTLGEIENALKPGSNVDALSDDDYTLLVEAVGEDEPNVQFINLLLDYGVNVNAIGMINESVLSRAVLNYNLSLDVVKRLVSLGADIHWRRERDNVTVLVLACLYNNAEIIKFLLDCGVEVNTKDNQDKTALMYATGRNHDNNLIRVLLDVGADITIVDKNGKRAEDHYVRANIYSAEIMKLLKSR